MSTMRVGTLAVVVILTAAACGGDAQDATAPANQPATSAEPSAETSSGDGTTAPADSAPTSPDATEPTATETTPPIVKIEVLGTAVAGNSGGVGEDNTQTLSESIRNDNGSCSGWEGPGDAGRWTQGLETGASVQILDSDSNEPIGDGQITSSSWADVDPGNREQWNCTFSFTGSVSKAADAFKIKVADLEPWLARPDPTNPGTYVASVDTTIQLSRVSSCADREAGQPIFEWQAVGQFWVDGLNTLCANGLVVEKIQRPCRPPTAGSEYVTAVRSADDPNVVFEDADGLHVDPEALQPDTKVFVDVATGRPC
jgi:hypothetical protein